MAFTSGVASVTASAVAICACGPQGVLVQNLGSVVVTLGGAGVVSGQGVTLPASMTSPILVPGRGPEENLAEGAADQQILYGIGASAGPSSVAFLQVN